MPTGDHRDPLRPLPDQHLLGAWLNAGASLRKHMIWPAVGQHYSCGFMLCAGNYIRHDPVSVDSGQVLVVLFVHVRDTALLHLLCARPAPSVRSSPVAAVHVTGLQSKSVLHFPREALVHGFDQSMGFVRLY